MSTHRGTWKARERSAATMFGTLRQIGSGSGGRPDETCSDSRHPRLFIECKLREKHTVITLWDATKALAARERKVPVIMLSEKGRPGQWLMCHTGDLDAVIVERLHAMSQAEQEAILKKLWKLRDQEGAAV